MSRVYYLIPADGALDKERDKLESLGVTVLAVAMVGRFTPRMVSHWITHPNTKGVVLPDDYRRHTEAIERIKQVARLNEIECVPLTRFLAANRTENPPATVSAVPANQRRAVVGQPTT